MKLKASAKKLNKKTLFFIFAAEGLLLTVLRFYQLSALTDPSTGFFTDKSNITVPLFYILWVLTVAASLILFYISSGCETGTCAAQKNIPHAVTSLLLGAAAVYDAYQTYAAGFRGLMGSGLFSFIRAQKAYITALSAAFALLSALILLADAVAFFTGKSFFTKLKFCQLFPVFWMFCTTVEYFSVTVSYLNVTQLMLTIFADAFLMVFLFEFARFLSGIGAEESPWLLYASGVIAEIFLCAAALPTVFFTLTGKTDRIVVHCPFVLYEAAAVLFIPTALYTAARNANYKVISFDPVTEEPKETAAEEENTAESTTTDRPAAEEE